MNLDLSGKTFLVLGASRGLGRAVAAELIGEGARVVLAARDPQAIAEAAHRLGDAAAGLALDVADPDIGAVGAAIDEHLGGALDGILISSGGPPAGRALELGEEDWSAAFRLLVAGPLRLLRALRPRLRAPASVLWVTSSSVRQPIPGLDASNLFRPGLAALAKSLARDLGPEVRVNSIAPGRIDTDRVRQLDAGRAEATGTTAGEQRRHNEQAIPLGRYGEPAELGRVAAFLLSPAASYVTGVSMQVDGGLVTAVP